MFPRSVPLSPPFCCRRPAMKFTSLLAFVSLISFTMAVNVTSADGTQIWAESTGNPAKPAVVFIPGFSCSSLAFDKQWENPYMNANLFMVRKTRPPSSPSPSDSLLWSPYFRCNRFGTMSVVRESAANLWMSPPMGPNSTLRILKPSSTTLELATRGRSWLDGSFGGQQTSPLI